MENNGQVSDPLKSNRTDSPSHNHALGGSEEKSMEEEARTDVCYFPNIDRMRKKRLRIRLRIGFGIENVIYGLSPSSVFPIIDKLLSKGLDTLALQTWNREHHYPQIT
jgi:hypothetical protein